MKYVPPPTGGDDTAIFAAAIATLDPNGDVLVVPEYSYSPTTINLGAKRRVTILMRGARIYQRAGATQSLIKIGDGINYTPDCLLIGGLLDGNANALLPSSGICGIEALGTENFRAKETRITAFPQHAMRYLGNATRYSAYGGTDDCYLTSCGGSAVSVEGQAYTVKCRGGIMSGNGRYVYPDGHQDNIAAFHAYGSDTHEVDGVTFDENLIDVILQDCSNCNIRPGISENVKRSNYMFLGGNGHTLTVGPIIGFSQELRLGYSAIVLSCQGSVIGHGSMRPNPYQCKHAVEELSGAANNVIDFLALSGAGGGIYTIPNNGSIVGQNIRYY